MADHNATNKQNVLVPDCFVCLLVTELAVLQQQALAEHDLEDGSSL